MILTGGISPREVVDAIAQAAREDNYAVECLRRNTGKRSMVCQRAIDDAVYHGYADRGLTLRTCWLTKKGSALLKLKEVPFGR